MPLFTTRQPESVLSIEEDNRDDRRMFPLKRFEERHDYT
jgi:hypothetical protein